LERAAAIEKPDFTFVVGRSQFQCPCSTFRAAFISPVVADLLSTDPTIDRFSIEGLPLESSSSSQSLIENLLRTGSIEMKNNDVELVAAMCRVLGNTELFA
jgi:hypothetical protein